MRAIVLAAGEGSRLRPFTATKPKPMVRVGNKPILQHVVEALVANGVHEITLVVGYQRAKVQAYFGDGGRFGARLEYAFQTALTGTTQALATAPAPGGPFLLLSGDNVVSPRLVARALEADHLPALVVHRSETPGKYGVVDLEGDWVARIVEKPSQPASSWVNTGVYHLPASFHAKAMLAARNGIVGLPDVLQQEIADATRVRAIRSQELWADAIHPWDLLRMNAQFLREPFPSARSFDGVTVEPPVLVGHDVSLGPGVVLGAGTVIGNGVQIRAHAVLENCVVYDDVEIAPFAMLQSTVVGEGTRIGPRVTSLAGPAHVRAADGWHDVEDLGAAIGEDCRIGGNVTFLSGAMVGNRAQIGPGRTVGGVVDDDAKVL